MSTAVLSKSRGASPLLILVLLAIMVFVLTMPLSLPTTTAAFTHTQKKEVSINGSAYQVSITSTETSCNGEIKNPEGKVIASHTSQGKPCSIFTNMGEIVREFMKQLSEIKNLSQDQILILIEKWGELGALLP